MKQYLLIILLAVSFLPVSTNSPATDNQEAGLWTRIDSLMSAAAHQEAMEVAKEILQIKKLNPGALVYEIGDVERMIDTLERAAGLPETEQQELADAYNLTPQYFQQYHQGNYAECEAMIEKQLEIRHRLLGETCQETINTIGWLAFINYVQGKYETASRQYEDALAKYRQYIGDDHPVTALCLENTAMVCEAQGNYQKAEQMHREALSIRRAVFGEQHGKVAESLNDLGALFYTKGDYKNAQPLYEEALAMRRALFGDKHLVVSISLNDLAALYSAQGNYTESSRLFRESLAIRRTQLGEDHIEVAKSLNNLATVLLQQGDYAAAEPLLRTALAKYRKILGNEHIDVASLLNNTGYLMQIQGDYAAARPLFDEALAIQIKGVGREHPAVAQTLNYIAMLNQKQENYDIADSLFREALAISKRAHGDTNPNVASYHDNLSINLRHQNRYDEAEEHNRAALAIHRQNFGEKHPDLAKDLNNLSKILLAQKKYPEAETYCRQALVMRKEMLGDEHPDVAENLYDLGILLMARKKFSEAERVLSESGRVYDNARARVGTGLKRVTFRQSPYPILALCRLELGNTAGAWPAIEKDLGRALADLLLTADQRSLNPAEAAREASLKSELSACERELTVYREATISGRTGNSAEETEEARVRLLAAEAQWSQFQAEMAGNYPLTEGQAFPLDRIQRSIDEKTVIIGWLDVEPVKDNYTSWVYVIQNSGPVIWKRLAARPAEELSPFKRILTYRNELTWPSSDPSGIKQLSRQIFIERIAPVNEALKSADHLVVIPSGAMLPIPLEALVDAERQFLSESFDVSYAPSATIYAWLHERAQSQPALTRGRTLLVGDPPFTESHLAAMETETNDTAPLGSSEILLDIATVRGALAGNKAVLASLPRLTASRAEIKAISAIARESNVLLGPDASEKNMVHLAESGELREFSTVHLATHALVDDSRPEMSALILSQLNLPDPLEAAMAGNRIYDGLITAKEVVREWSLEADLVALSACATALGRVVGGEGYVGFSHAFFQAGAKSVLVSLWEVSDRATSLLMQRFYENYFGTYQDQRAGRKNQALSKIAALREAKQWLRNYSDEQGHHPFTHPYYWSAFILIGESGTSVN